MTSQENALNTAPEDYSAIRQGLNDAMLSSGASEPKIKRSTIVSGICVALCLFIVAIYAWTLTFGFVNLNDGPYVYANPRVLHGVTVDNLMWAFTSTHASFWHPLTTISHMLDSEIYGNWTGGRHLTNIVIHAATTVVLFLALLRMTGNLWPSAFAAAAFAVHPLRVESVAWITERKDVLSGLFFSLTLLAYARHAERPSPWRLLLVALMFSFGLMSKPMLVTVPFVFLLLDYWPMRRLYVRHDDQINANLSRSVILEKLPLLALACVACVVTLDTQGQAIHAGAEVPFAARVANAALSYIAYIRQMLVPIWLSVFYPFPRNGAPTLLVLGAFAVLISITWATIVLRKRFPYLLVGWLWYVGMLVPVIGLVQAGLQSRADRFTYLPQIGLIIAVAWGVADLSAQWKFRRLILSIAAAVILLTWSALAFAQTSHWRKSTRLFDYAVYSTQNNAVAHRLLADALVEEGDLKGAAEQLRKALSIKPHYAHALSDYGVVLFYLDVAEDGVNQRLGEAASRLHAGLALDPSNVRALTTLANVSLRLGRTIEVEPLVNQALQLDPQSAVAYFVLGELRMKQGKREEAIAYYQRALGIEPGNVDIHLRLGIAYYRMKKPGDALAEFREAVRLAPNDLKVLYFAARVAATSEYPEARSGQEAVVWSTHAADISKRQIPDILDILAASYAEVGRTDDAKRTAEKALSLAVGIYAPRKGIIQTHLKVFESGGQLRDSLSDLQ